MTRRVLIVSNRFPPQVVGGAEVVAHRQAVALRARGWEVAVLAGGLPGPGLNPGSLSSETLDGIEVFRFTLRPWRARDAYSAEAERVLGAVLLAHRPDVVHVHNWEGLGANLIPAAKRAGARVVVTLHDHGPYCFKGTLMRNNGAICDDPQQCAVCAPRAQVHPGFAAPIRLRRDYVLWCLDQADAIVAPSRYLAASASRPGLLRQQVAALSNGIDLDRVRVSTRDSGAEGVRFACFSYLGEHKGIPSLLDAAERLARDETLSGRWSLAVAGHGPLAAALVADVARGRFGDAVTYAGHLPREEALALLARSDVSVLASIWPENEPVTLMEAIAAGKAQLASRLGGNVELIADNRSGLTFAPGSGEDLARQMRRLIREPGLARAFGRFNAERRHAFGEEATIDRLTALYGAPPSAPGPAAQVVLCVGTQVSDELALMMHRLHALEAPGPNLRFIPSDWACSRAWRDACLVWLMDDGDAEAAEAAAGRASRSGIPVLAPRGSRFAGQGGGAGPGRTFATALEAAAAITATAAMRAGA